ncbi:hypothetical protein CBR_g41771 [Chara braunii]|uniref:non-specific serine/threonine protein kinase n=1 Tax=Chara braunii TaxID=69332 RepID=A0A388LWK2_CHABU|nr:hypothetical protein CBR_g41771 [Chara braunii]|eukprot:GBG86707.1 hypothetical protein CBR_g41771 [Chara braunii]
MSQLLSANATCHKITLEGRGRYEIGSHHHHHHHHQHHHHHHHHHRHPISCCDRQHSHHLSCSGQSARGFPERSVGTNHPKKSVALSVVAAATGRPGDHGASKEEDEQASDRGGGTRFSTSTSMTSTTGSVEALTSTRGSLDGPLRQLQPEDSSAEASGGEAAGEAAGEATARMAPSQQEMRANGAIGNRRHGCGDSLKEGEYVIKGLLGEGGGGGRGNMYEAETRDGDRVAVKVLSLRSMSGWKDLELFEREARVLRSLSHPAIPEYLDYFEVDSAADRSFYLVQKIAYGHSLQELVSTLGFRFSEDEVVDIAVEVLLVLSYLESRRPPVVHRDIKPSNIIVDVKSGMLEETWTGHVKVVDFGAVQDVAAMGSTFLASTVVGTYGYMAPEQFQNRSVSQSDLYALGGTMLYLLTGRQPSEFPQRRLKIQFRDRAQMSGYLADVLDKLLEPAPEDRFQSAQDVISALRGERKRAAAGGAVVVPPRGGRAVATAVRGRLFLRRRPPAGSKVSMSATGRELVLEIPPLGFTSDAIGTALFAVAWNAFTAFWTGSAIAAGAPLLFPLFSLPFWGVGVHLARLALMSTMTRTRLRIVAGGAFSISWNIADGLWEDAVHGRWEDVVTARVVVEYEQNGEPMTACELMEGVRRHRFGSGLSEIEKVWIVEGINDFLLSERNNLVHRVVEEEEEEEEEEEFGRGRRWEDAVENGKDAGGSSAGGSNGDEGTGVGPEGGGEDTWLLSSAAQRRSNLGTSDGLREKHVARRSAEVEEEGTGWEEGGLYDVD